MNTNNNKQLITMIVIGLIVAALIAAGIYFIPTLLSTNEAEPTPQTTVSTEPEVVDGDYESPMEEDYVFDPYELTPEELDEANGYDAPPVVISYNKEADLDSDWIITEEEWQIWVDANPADTDKN